MGDGSTALFVFYGVFWAAALNAVGRLHAFDTHTLFSSKRHLSSESRCRAWNRFIAGVVTMNFYPILWFWLLYKLLYVWIIPNGPGVIPIIAAAIASLSVFGFNRILHAIIATECYSKFYSQEEWDKVKKQWGRDDYDPNTFRGHVIPGILYLIIFPLIAGAFLHHAPPIAYALRCYTTLLGAGLMLIFIVALVVLSYQSKKQL